MGADWARPRVDAVGAACCGCGACAAACPRGCVSMAPDAEGFLRPEVDTGRCDGCGLCGLACPAVAAREGRLAPDEPRSVRWAYARDGGLLDRSSSGGVFGLLARDCLSRGGAVYGAAFSGDLRSVRHARAGSTGELGPLLRSKYVQSEVGREVYAGVASDLREGRPVLFCGTACQVAGLRLRLSALRVPADGLLCADVICHGAPSPALWRAWAAHLGTEEGSALAGVNFRAKDPSWEGYSLEYRFADGGRRLVGHLDDWYLLAFLKNICLRPSCAACPAKRRCGSDLTLGDFWGVGAAHPEVPRERGVSAVVINTEAGERALERISGDLESGPSGYASVLAGNPSLERPPAPHPDRGAFMAALAAGAGVDGLMARWPLVAGVRRDDASTSDRPSPPDGPGREGIAERVRRAAGRALRRLRGSPRG